MSRELTVVTCSVQPKKTLEYWRTWREQAAEDFRLVLVVSGQGTSPEKLDEEVNAQLQDGDAIVMRERVDGCIPAFLSGVEEACKDGVPEIIACFHDDLEILEGKWDERIFEVFNNESVLLAGFGGGTGLGASDIYSSPYSPFQLARQDFVSNMQDAEAHGRRSRYVEKVACLDGFSQVGRGQFIAECYYNANQLGILHHFYDSLFGAWCRKAGFEARMIPVACKHAGGVTAVGSEEYQKFARKRYENGDQGVWEYAHKVGYEECRGVLPFSVREE